MKARAAATGKAQDDAFADLLEVLNERLGDWRITAVSLYEGGPFKNGPPVPQAAFRSRLSGAILA